ncbi:MAG: helix-turn-helix transcriptional regulator [Clostridia bacterium]|nr:helix-turn-helix transcriptional regulator [Clostridia bacterium]
MYINRAYLGEPHEEIVNTAAPLSVTAVGNFRLHSKKIHKTERKDGRADYQLIYVAKGKLHLYAEDKDHIVQKGNMILFRPGEPQIYSLYAKDKPETYWVHFTGNNVERILEYYHIPKGASVIYTGLSRNYKWLFRQMIQELQLQRANFSDMNVLQLRQLFLYISRNISGEMPVPAELLDEIEQAMHYFNKNFYRPIVIEDYAKEHHMTPWWFIQNFKKIAQVTPVQYIVSLRISNAMNLLDSTDDPVTKIAGAVGYDNALYFSRLFKKHVGISPREYRKRRAADKASDKT